MTDLTVITHADNCWSWGPKHYKCAVREIRALRAEVAEWKSVAVAQSAEVERLRDAAPAVQGEPVAYISQEDFELLLSDDMSEQYGTRQAPVFSRKDCRVSVPLYASPQPPAQDVSALVEALEDIRSRSSMNLAMNPNPFELTTRLGDIYQIADAALAKENSND